MPTSSGAVERLVSIFGLAVSDRQRRSKEDTIEARTIIPYNHRNQNRRRHHRFDDDVPPEIAEQDYSEEEEVLDEGNPAVEQELAEQGGDAGPD